MKIVLVLHQHPPYGSGGTEQLACWTASALRASGHEVRVVSAIPGRSRTHRNVEAEHEGANADVVFLPFAARPDASFDRVRAEYDDPDAGAAFASLLDACRPDVVHFLHLAGVTTAALRETVARRIPALVMCTDFWFECPTIQLMLSDGTTCGGAAPTRLNCARHLLQLRYPSLHGIEHAAWLDPGLKLTFEAARRFVPESLPITRVYENLGARSETISAAMKRASWILAPTPHMHERLVAFGVPADRVRVVAYGVPQPMRIWDAASEWRGDLRVAFIGTLAIHKGAHVLLEALRHRPFARLVLDIYGSAADHRYADRLAHLASDDKRVRFKGPISIEEVDEVLSLTDLLVIPSIWHENAPLIALQAVAYRCPILAADVPGLRACVREDKDGWFFPRGGALNLGAALATLEEHRDRLIDIRQSRFRARTVGEFAAELVTLYEASIATDGMHA